MIKSSILNGRKIVKRYHFGIMLFFGNRLRGGYANKSAMVKLNILKIIFHSSVFCNRMPSFVPDSNKFEYIEFICSFDIGYCHKSVPF
jgi:hypothetical protein